MNCTSCGDKYDTTRYSRTDGLCSKCGARKYHREYMRKKNHSEKHYRSCYDDHRGGVIVMYHGCATPDKMSKSMFMRNLGAFEVGDRYKIDGEWREIGA